MQTHEDFVAVNFLVVVLSKPWECVPESNRYSGIVEDLSVEGSHYVDIVVDCVVKNY